MLSKQQRFLANMCNVILFCNHLPRKQNEAAAIKTKRWWHKGKQKISASGQAPKNCHCSPHTEAIKSIWKTFANVLLVHSDFNSLMSKADIRISK